MLDLLAVHSADLIEVVGSDHLRSWVSPSVQHLLGYDPEELIGSSVLSRVLPEDRAVLEELLQRCADDPNEPVRAEYRLTTQSGRSIFVDVVARNLLGNESVAGMVLTSRDITERVQRERKMFDAVTGLPNRVVFLDRLDAALRRASNDPNYLLAVLSLDLDRFKVVNEGLGHDAGDLLLHAVARRLESCMGPRDTLAHPGGDEFSMLFEDLSDPDDSRKLADDIHQALSEPFRIAESEIYTTASIGISTNVKGYDEAAHMLRDAETAMNRAKSAGHRHETFSTVMHIEALKQVQLDTDLRRAIDREEFSVLYQPIVFLSSGELAGFESLVRWIHPEEGLVSPAEFIPVAEETGLIAPIDRWVLNQSCEAGAGWLGEWQGPKPLWFSVNISSTQFSRKDLVGYVEQVLQNSGIEAGQLKLEITESAIMESPEAALESLQGLRGLGVRLALDDFGTGYSSLSYLHRFPFDTLKIDQSFVSRLGQPDDQMGIVRTIIALADNMGMDVVAEGIEDQAQWDILSELGCLYGQGYYFARPLEPRDALQRVRKPRFE